MMVYIPLNKNQTNQHHYRTVLLEFNPSNSLSELSKNNYILHLAFLFKLKFPSLLFKIYKYAQIAGDVTH